MPNNNEQEGHDKNYGWTASSLLTVAKEHKEKCDGSCSVSMFLLGMLYKKLVERELTEEESNIFI